VISDDGPPQRELVERMCSRMVHRGPDDAGIHASGSVAMGMRRLSIIDLEGGHQPIYNEDRSVAVVQNGEIYNYRQLHDRLVEQGHEMATRSDTEVLVHLYEDHGASMVGHLRGMFAFIIHDMERRRVLMARDRLGIKPLHYAVVGDTLYAASEIKCLLAVPEISRELDPVAVEQYFSLLYVPAPRTIFRSIRKLPPGHLLSKSPGKPPEIERYWALETAAGEARSEEEWIEGFRERFDDAVASHMVADVPVGVFLSGGIDSGALIAALARRGFQRVKTFTLGVGSQYAAFDERDRAREVAARYATDHTELEVQPDIKATIERLARILDEPLADSGAVPNLIVCELARSHLPVVLTGLGGDELAGGYERYLGVKLATHYRRIPAWLRRSIIEPVVNAVPEPRQGSRGIGRAKRFVRHGALPWLERYCSFTTTLGAQERRQLFTPALEAELDGNATMSLFREIAASIETEDLVNRLLAIDISTYLVDDLLAVADRTSMAVSLEARVPFLDHPLVEFAASVPGDLKIRGTRKKYLLRRAFQQDLPESVVHGKKSGFSLPIAGWLRGELRELLDTYLDRDRITRQGLFEPDTIDEWRRQHDERRSDQSQALWAMLMFQLWSDNYAAS